MYLSAVILLGIAGCLFCIAAFVYWRRIANSQDAFDKLSMIIVGFAMLSLSASLVLSLIDRTRPEFTYAVLSTWSAVAAILFVKRFLAMPSRSLLMVPIGALAIMFAVVAVMGPPPVAAGEQEQLPLVTMIHIIFMALFLGANLVGSGAALGYFLADRQLKHASARAFKLPSLPALRRVNLTGLVSSCAMLFAGLATGAAATKYTEDFDYLHPIVLISLLSMLLLLLVLFVELTKGLSQKSLSIVTLFLLVLAVLSVLSLNLYSPYA